MKKTILLDQLLLYRSLLHDPIIYKMCDFFDSKEKTPPSQLLAELIQSGEQLGLEGNLGASYLLHRIATDENILSITAEKTGGTIGSSLREAALHDISILRKLLLQEPLTPHIASYVPTAVNSQTTTAELKSLFLSEEKTVPTEALLQQLLVHYATWGYSELAFYKAFRWKPNRGLDGILHCDSIRLEELVGYERQKAALVQNTEAFLQGKPAHNILLSGDRGTGKSSSVKALINHYFTQGLRLVEVAKQDLPFFHELLQNLRTKGKKFIIFLDDLSFEEFEIEYKHLKSVMEGGIENKPKNVLIYATSNRRHLIRENWSDRNDNPEDIHRFDTMNEKISLSDRFGITLTYLSPNQEEYLNIVKELANRHGLSLSEDQLIAQALKWERAHAGRSGRTARDFIISVEKSSS